MPYSLNYDQHNEEYTIQLGIEIDYLPVQLLKHLFSCSNLPIERGWLEKTDKKYVSLHVKVSEIYFETMMYLTKKVIR